MELAEPRMWWSAHITLLFGEVPYLQRPEMAARTGFRSVETAWPDADPAVFAQAIRRCGLSVECLNAYGGDLPGGDRGFLNDPRRVDEADAAFDAALALASEVDARCIHVLLGRELDDVPLREQMACAVSALRRYAPRARQANMPIVIEAINHLDSPGYLTPTIAAVDSLLDEVGEEGLSILFDAYHVARAGDDLVETLRQYAPRIGHVQFSDCPGRGAPGSGEIDLPGFVRELAAHSYRGPIGLEWFPRTATATEIISLPQLSDVAPLVPPDISNDT